MPGPELKNKKERRMAQGARFKDKKSYLYEIVGARRTVPFAFHVLTIKKLLYFFAFFASWRFSLYLFYGL